MQKQASAAQKRKSQRVRRKHRSQAKGFVRSVGVTIGRFVGRRTRAGHANGRTSECCNPYTIHSCLYVNFYCRSFVLIALQPRHVVRNTITRSRRHLYTV